MTTQPSHSPHRGRADGLLVLIAIAVLLICLLYTLAYVFLLPYPGISLNDGWVVLAVDPRDAHPGWREADRNCLQAGDRLLAIGSLAYQDYSSDRRRVPFDGYGPGDAVPIIVSRNGHRLAIHWQMPAVTTVNRAKRLGVLVLSLPFWLVGTLVLLFLRPRDRRWQLLIAFNYTTGFWLVVGVISGWRVAAASLVLHAVTWLLVPIYLHLHLLVPTPRLRSRARYVLLLLYVSAVILAALELLQLLPASAYALGLLLAVSGSLGLLVLRLFDRSSPAARSAAGLMLAGIGLALGPGLVLGLIPDLLNSAAPGSLMINAAVTAVPVLPLTYTYAIYKRRLGPLEFRANRLLSLYGFALLYLAAFTLVLLAGRPWLPTADEFLAFVLAVAAVFVVGASALRTRFQRLVDRLVYGIQYNPDELLHAFATRIPTALDRETLARLLADEVAPSLLIRQSALVLLADGDPKQRSERYPEPFDFAQDRPVEGSVEGRNRRNAVGTVYARGVSVPETPETFQELRRLLAEAGWYRPPRAEGLEVWNEAPDRPAFDWVRLAIPLETRQSTIGVWLFGRRAPEDYYPQPDIDLLTALAGQVIVALENARLYEVVQQELVERQQAQEALHESEERYRDLYENAPIAYFSVGVDGSIIRCNRRAEKLLGYTRADLVGRSIFELYTDAPQGKREASQVFQRFRVGGTTTTGELQMQGADGTPVWISLTVNAVRDARGQVVESRSMVMDITARRQAEAALRESEKRYRTLYESAPIGIGLTTPEGQLLTCNDAMCQITSYSEAELRQIDLQDTYQNPQDHARLLEQLQTDGHVHNFEVGLRRKDGTPYYASLTMSSFTLDDQDVLLMMFQDITARKQAEEELRHSQTQLIQSAKMAAVGTLAAGIAHELCNPLAVVQGFGEVLLKRMTDGDLARKGLTHIVTESRRASDIVQRLLDFSRQAEHGQVPADVNQVMQDTLALVRQLLSNSSVTIKEYYASDLPPIPLDVSRMKQVFLNLVNNALQAMPQGGTLTVTSERVDHEVAVRIADTGVGIPADHLPRIFEPFFTTKPVGQGTGLGLSVSLGIVQDHEGRIEVESREGEGSTFTVLLPVQAADEPDRVAGEGPGSGDRAMEDLDRPSHAD